MVALSIRNAQASQIKNFPNHVPPDTSALHPPASETSTLTMSVDEHDPTNAAVAINASSSELESGVVMDHAYSSTLGQLTSELLVRFRMTYFASGLKSKKSDWFIITTRYGFDDHLAIDTAL